MRTAVDDTEPSLSQGASPGSDEGHHQPTDRVEISESRVSLQLTVDDAALAEHLSARSPDGWPDEVARVLAVGVRGLATMGMTASVARVGDEVERVLADVADVAEQRVSDLLTAHHEQMLNNLDPAVKTSWSAKTVLEIRDLHAELLSGLDPSNRSGHTGRLIDELQTLLGPGGLLERRLDEALDPTSDESGLAKLQLVVERRFAELRDAVVGGRARSEEAIRGTAKGFDFEDHVESLLRVEAGRLGGCTVDATGTEAGSLGAVAKVGDFVLSLPSGPRIVIEAKNAARIQLTGKGGILAELDQAMANRDADFAICVAGSADAYPAEVGLLGVYGNRVLVADDGSGVTVRAAVRWAAAAVTASATAESSVDPAAMADGLCRIKELATRLSSLKRSLATIRSGVDQVRNDVDAVRGELLDHVDDLSRGLAAGSDAIEASRVA